MKKEMNNIEEIENVIEEEVVETEPKQKFGSKIIGGVKKHAKKVAAGAAIVGVGLIGYVLGQKNAGSGEDEFDEDADFESDEGDFAEEVDPE